MTTSNWECGMGNGECSEAIRLSAIPHSPFPTPHSPRRGLALVVVLIVVAMLSLSGYTFSQLMFAEYQAADAHGKSLQARLLCESGVEKLLFLLNLDHMTLMDRGGHYDNPAELQGIPVLNGSTSADRGRFTVIAPRYQTDAPTSLRYGLEDESAKLNLNTLISEIQDVTLQRTALMNLPGMTEEIADSILDWIDEDEETREFGAEADYYSGLSPPYAPRNGPLDTLEELLLVMGVTPAFLFGQDLNRNGLVDGDEGFAALPEGVDADGTFERGWSGYLTLHGAESNESLAGEPRINLNSTDLEKLYADLSASELSNIATFAITYRQSGPYSGSAQASNAPLPPIDFTKQARYKFSSVLDLIGATTSAVSGNATVAVPSPLTNDPITLGATAAKLVDLLTTTDDLILRGRINVNHAPLAVLMCVPNMTEEIADKIISTRSPESSKEDPESEQITWLLNKLVMTIDELKPMLPYITTQGGVFRAQIVGYFEAGGPAARAEAIIDATCTPPRQLFWREITPLGPGFDVHVLGFAGP